MTRAPASAGETGRKGETAPTRFIVVRHGETQWNVEARVQGHLDSPLTPQGHLQADAIARRLESEAFDLVIASDLGRALQTAQRITGRSGHEVVLDPRLRERHFGEGEGLTYGELDARWPDVFSRVRDTDPDASIPGGETRREFHERVAAAFDALAREHGGRRVLVVAHGGVLAALYRIVHGIPVGKPHAVPIANASYNAITFDARGWTLDAWNDTAHLPGAVPFVES
jgi:probable phosphoglycerate mutase